MLRLSAPRREPYWLDLVPGVRVKVKPITVAAIIAARQAAADAAKDGGDDMIYNGSAAFTRRMARWGIVEWEGVGDADGNPVDPTPENIDALLEHWRAFDAIDGQYVVPALIQDAEKNGSSLSPNGISAGAKATARRARKPAKPAHT
jgi:hypothetical protein